MGEAGFEGIRKSIMRRQNIVAQYVATQPIMDLCERSDRRPGVRVSRRWWEQDGIDLEGAKKGQQRQRQIRSRNQIQAERSQVEQVGQVEWSGVEWKSECP